MNFIVLISGGRFHGHVDFGDGNESEEEATHALVFMVVALNGSWKLPIAHFFTTSINGEDQANLISIAISLLNETKVVITNITCDNAASNLSSIRILGGSVNDYRKLKCSIDIRNVLNIPIFVILDPCHILKLVRNALSDYKIIYSSLTSSPAKWSQISALHDLQISEGLHLGNKLSTSHVYFHRQKMRVYLAAQVEKKRFHIFS